MHHYKESNGCFILMDGDREIGTPTKRIAFLVDKASATIHRHGDSRIVELVFRNYVEKYAQAGMYDIANDLMVIDVTTKGPEEINRCLDSTTYVRRFIEEATDVMWPRIHPNMTGDDIKQLRGMILARRKVRDDERRRLEGDERYEQAATARDVIGEWDKVLADLSFIEEVQKRLEEVPVA